MNVLSLFSGIGGLDLGLERAGMTIAGQVEIDPWCRTVLAKHWPEVPRHDDVRTAAGWWRGRRAPDLVCGGFPCQPVSTAGKRLAQADSRWLWPAFAGVIRDLRPRYVLVENVTGLLGRGMGDVLGDLAALGYDAEWDCIPAAFVGAPHIRNRVWVLAYLQCGICLGADHGGESRILADSDDDQPHQPEGEVRPADQRPVSGRLAVGAGGSGEQGRWSRWAPEPAVGRMVDGPPSQLDELRLRGIGNAVVPQVAERIGRLILRGEAA